MDFLAGLSVGAAMVLFSTGQQNQNPDQAINTDLQVQEVAIQDHEQDLNLLIQNEQLANQAIQRFNRRKKEFLKACSKGDYETVKMCVEEKGIDINTKNRRKEIGLHLACHVDEVRMDYYIELGSRPNASDEDKKKAMRLKNYLQGTLSVVDYLLTKGINVNAIDKSYATALSIACRYKRADIVERLFQEDNVDLNFWRVKIGRCNNESPFSEVNYIADTENFKIAKLFLQDSRFDINNYNIWSRKSRYSFDNFLLRVHFKEIKANKEMQNNYKTALCIILERDDFEMKYINKLLLQFIRLIKYENGDDVNNVPDYTHACIQMLLQANGFLSGDICDEKYESIDEGIFPSSNIKYYYGEFTEERCRDFKKELSSYIEQEKEDRLQFLSLLQEDNYQEAEAFMKENNKLNSWPQKIAVLLEDDENKEYIEKFLVYREQ